MTALWIALAVMCATTAAALLWPLFRRRSAPARSSFELGVYRDQLAELDRDLERGLIAPAEARAARLEIERRILRAADDGSATSLEPAGAGHRSYVAVAAVLVPALAVALYAQLGEPRLPDQPLASRTDREPNGPGGPDVGQIVAQLEARLAESPGDLEGWLMLGRSRGVLGDAQSSLDAYRRAQALAGDDPRVLGALGESLVVAGGGVVTPEAKDLFHRLAERSADDPRPAFYLGLADSQAGDYQKALERWQALLAAAPADAPWRERVAEAVRGAAVELKLDPEAVLAQTPSAPAPAALPQPSEEDMARAAAMSPEQQQALIRNMVDRLQARMDADGSDVEGWLRLAQARIVLGELDRARTAFEQGLRLHPDETLLLKGYASLLLGPVRPDTGLPEIGEKPAELYGKAARLQPADPEPWYYLGIRALQEGRKDEARSSWEKVLANLDPSHPEYAAIKERLGQLGG